MIEKKLKEFLYFIFLLFFFKVMEEQQSARSAWPDPPTYYKRYTTENLELLKQAQKADDYESTLDFPLKQLEPPLPPTDDYSVFDQKWQVFFYPNSFL